MTPYDQELVDEVADVEDDVVERVDQEEARVCDWRFDRLGRIGLSDTTERLDFAASCVDVHDLERLLEMGCALDLAIRIVR
jgi:hypothetical protein